MWSNPRVPFQLSNKRNRLEPPDGKPLIVHIAMNIEYWPFDRPMPRGIMPAPHGAKSEPPDVPNFGWVEYGLRCGMPRIMEMLQARNLTASAFINAQVADIYPSGSPWEPQRITRDSAFSVDPCDPPNAGSVNR